MKIVVPAAGDARRFVEQGYTVPKPLVEIDDKPLIKWATDSIDFLTENDQFIFLVRQSHIQDYGIDRILHQLYPVGSEIIAIEATTEGAACTALLAKGLIDTTEDLLLMNCDLAFRAPLKSAISKWRAEVAGIITTFQATDAKFSFAQTDNEDFVTVTAEKQAISNRATVGAYYFSQGAHFVWASEQMIAKNIRINNEFYIAPTYNELIGAGYKVKAIESELSLSLGTPEEIDDFIQSGNLDSYR